MKTESEVRPELIEQARTWLKENSMVPPESGPLWPTRELVRAMAAFAQSREAQGHDLRFWKESALALTTLLKMRCTPKEWDEINAMLDLPVPPSPTQGGEQEKNNEAK